MNLFERSIAAVSPGWALRRARARSIIQAFHEVAEPGRLRKHRTDRASANAENSRSAEKVRIQARHLEENLDIASGALDVLVDNTVGTGIQPEPQVELESGEPAEELNRAFAELWDDWIYFPEVTGQLDYYALQRLVCRTLYRDGESFGQQLTGRVPFLDHNTVVPYSLEALEPDFVPYDFNDPARGIVQGIELNTWGRPRAYHVYKQHPGERNVFQAVGDYKRVPADRVMHLKLTKRLHQARGMSVFAPVIARLDDLKEIDESERVAARVAAAMALFIRKGEPAGYEGPYQTDPATGKAVPRLIDINPGTVVDDLGPGESVESFSSNRPNNGLIPFRDSQLRGAAAGFGASYSSISRNYDGTYSSQRQELVEQYQHYRALQGYFIYRYAQPVWDGFVAAAIVSGAVTVPAGVKASTLYNCSHAAPQMPWIDPDKEMSAHEKALKLKLKSRTKIIRETGQKPTEVNREIVQDKNEREKQGIEIEDSKPAPAAPDKAAEPEEKTRKEKQKPAARKRA